MLILEDTRQQTDKHDLKHKWFEENGIKIERCRLYVGDYTLPTNQSVCIDTKKDLFELCSNICQQHDRFRREVIRAQEAGIQLIILCEHGEGIKSLDDVFFWQNPRKHKVTWRTVNGKRVKKVVSSKAMDGEQLYKALNTISQKYGVRFEFCRKEETGRRIKELLEKR